MEPFDRVWPYFLSDFDFCHDVQDLGDSTVPWAQVSLFAAKNLNLRPACMSLLDIKLHLFPPGWLLQKEWQGTTEGATEIKLEMEPVGLPACAQIPCNPKTPISLFRRTFSRSCHA